MPLHSPSSEACYFLTQSATAHNPSPRAARTRDARENSPRSSAGSPMTAVSYFDLAAQPVSGIFWCPGPLPRSVWVLPYPGARSSEAVVVKLPNAKSPQYRQVNYVPTTEVAMSYRDQRGDLVYIPTRAIAQACAQKARSAPPLESKEIRALEDQGATECTARLSWGERCGCDETSDQLDVSPRAELDGRSAR